MLWFAAFIALLAAWIYSEKLRSDRRVFEAAEEDLRTARSVAIKNGIKDHAARIVAEQRLAHLEALYFRATGKRPDYRHVDAAVLDEADRAHRLFADN